MYFQKGRRGARRVRGRGVGEEEPTHLLYSPRQAREAEGEGEIKNHRPHTTIHRLPTVHPRGSPQLPVPLHSFLSLSLSCPSHHPLPSLSSSKRGYRAETTDASLVVQFSADWIPNRKKFDGKWSRFQTTCGNNMRDGIPTGTQGRSFFFSFPFLGTVRKEESFPIDVSGSLPRISALLDPRRSVLFRP